MIRTRKVKIVIPGFFNAMNPWLNDLFRIGFALGAIQVLHAE